MTDDRFKELDRRIAQYQRDRDEGYASGFLAGIYVTVMVGAVLVAILKATGVI